MKTEKASLGGLWGKMGTAERGRKVAYVQRAGVLFGRLRGRRKAKGKRLESRRRECWCRGRVSVGLC
jgi:hypothetical protein